MTTSAARTKRVLTYSLLEDPSTDEVAKIQQLPYLYVLEISYGMALVEIQEDNVSKLKDDLPLWTLSNVARLKP